MTKYKANDGKLKIRKQENVKCKCGKRGNMRYDNGLKCGVHCDKCWEDLLYECKQRCW